MSQELSKTKSFYELFKILEQTDRGTIVTTRDGGTESDVIAVLEDWKANHSDADVRLLCEIVLDEIA